MGDIKALKPLPKATERQKKHEEKEHGKNRGREREWTPLDGHLETEHEELSE
jgi:hypothetical protein